MRRESAQHEAMRLALEKRRAMAVVENAHPPKTYQAVIAADIRAESVVMDIYDAAGKRIGPAKKADADG